MNNWVYACRPDPQRSPKPNKNFVILFFSWMMGKASSSGSDLSLITSCYAGVKLSLPPLFCPFWCWHVFANCGVHNSTVQMLDIEVKKKTMKGKMNKTYKIVKPHASNDTSFSRNLFPLPFRQRQSLGLWSLTLQRNSSCDSVCMKEVVLEDIT